MLRVTGYRTGLRQATIFAAAGALRTPQLVAVRTFGPFGSQSLDKNHYETKVVPFTPEQVFDVVANVNQYKEFIPWCLDSRIIHRNNGKQMEAELTIGFPPFTEKYVSVVTMERPKKITVKAAGNAILFSHLTTSWEFRAGPRPNTTLIGFNLSFGFKSRLHRTAVNLFYDELVATMVKAFEGRCATVYGRRPVTIVRPEPAMAGHR